MPSVPKETRKARAEALRQAGDAALRRFMETQVGGRAEVLIEKENTGFSEHYTPIRLETPAEGGDIVPVRVTA